MGFDVVVVVVVVVVVGGGGGNGGSSGKEKFLKGSGVVIDISIWQHDMSQDLVTVVVVILVATVVVTCSVLGVVDDASVLFVESSVSYSACLTSLSSMLAGETGVAVVVVVVLVELWNCGSSNTMEF